MGEREHLGGLGVGPVDEYQRRQIIRQREAAKFIRVKTPVIVVEY